jgi:hypothetical protein
MIHRRILPLLPDLTQQHLDDMDSTTFVPEAEFATRLGLPRKAVADVRVRALTEGPHWRRNEDANGRIELSGEGAALVMDELKIGTTEAPAAAAPIEAVLIVSRQVPNARQVLAVREDDPTRAVLVLQVPTVKIERQSPAFGTVVVNHFRANTRVRARHVTGAVWAFVGKKPRWPGDPQSQAPKKAEPGDSLKLPGDSPTSPGDSPTSPGENPSGAGEGGSENERSGS